MPDTRFTLFHYLYRDKSNYKAQNFVVLSGAITQEQEGAIKSCLNEGEYFIPRQVGLPERRFDSWDPEDDHCWFEFCSFEPLPEMTQEQADANGIVPVMSVQELTDKFLAAKDNWKEYVYDF